MAGPRVGLFEDPVSASSVTQQPGARRGRGGAEAASREEEEKATQAEVGH